MKIDKEDIFLKTPHVLLNASGYVSDKGEQVKLNLSDKILYLYIKSRADFFKSIGKEYYDSQQSIADFCNIDLKTCGVILRKFETNGVVHVIKKPHGNFLKNFYKRVDDLTLWGGRGAFEINSTLNKEYITTTATKDTVLTDTSYMTRCDNVVDDYVIPDNYFKNVEEDHFDAPF